MLVTLLGIVIEMIELQPEKAFFPILVTLLGMMVNTHPNIRVLSDFRMMALQLFLLSYTLLPFSTSIYCNEQSENAFVSIFVTLLGIVIEERALQPRNAFWRMPITPFEIVTDFRLEQL